MNRPSDGRENDEFTDERDRNKADADEQFSDGAIDKPDGRDSMNREDRVVKKWLNDDRRHLSTENEKQAEGNAYSSNRYFQDVEPFSADETDPLKATASQQAKESSNVLESELFLIDLDRVIGENSNLLHTLTQHESTGSFNLANNKNFINSGDEVHVKTAMDKIIVDSRQSQKQAMKENTAEKTADHKPQNKANEKPTQLDTVLEEQNDNNVSEYKRKSKSHTQDTKCGTPIRRGLFDKQQAEISSKTGDLSDEHFTLNCQWSIQPATKAVGGGKEILKEITSGFFKARKSYLKCKNKAMSELKKENVNTMMKRFSSESQPDQNQASTYPIVTLHSPNMSFTLGKTDTKGDIESNIRPPTREKSDLVESGSTSHLSRTIHLKQVLSPTGSMELQHPETPVDFVPGKVEKGKEHHDIAETETSVTARKCENHESEYEKYDKKHNKENNAIGDIICEFDDTETEADSDVFDIDLSRLDETNRQSSNELTRTSKNESINFQDKQKFQTDEIVPDSNSDSEDEQTDKMWLNFQFGKYATLQDKSSQDSTICGKEITSQNACTIVDNKHATVHHNTTRNAGPKEHEQTIPHSTCLQNSIDTPNRSNEENTCATDTPLPFENMKASTSRLSLSKGLSSMKSMQTNSPDSIFNKTNKCTAADNINGTRSSHVHDDETDVFIPETPSHMYRQTNSALASYKDSNCINVPKGKESADFSGESDQSFKKKETAALKMKEGEIIKRVSGVIHDLKIALNATPVRKDARISALRQELSSLEDKTTIPKTVIAVVGDTGSGKSSILNALLGHRSVLPTSGIRACTAVAVEIEDNVKNNMFEADIEFLTNQEWDQELNLLMNDLFDWKGKFRKSPPKPDTDTYISYMKVLAVYGKVDKKENLDQITNVTNCLGKTETISCVDPVEFRQKVEQYISQPQKADGDVVGEFWPIVKLVHFRLPQCAILSSGAVLVDLPGLRDFNLAREKVSKEYLKNCSSVWIVSSIHRAIDDKAAKTLLNETFQRQMYMDGRYGNVTFICSKTDDLKPSEIIRDLKLEPITQSLEQELSVAENQKSLLQQKLQDCQEAEQCESSEGTTRNSSSEIQKISKRISEIKLQINMHRRKLYGICAKERNKYAKTQIKEDFAAGFKKLKHDAERGDQEEYDDYDDDSDDDEDDNKDYSCIESLQVFCCSANEYQKLKYPSSSDGPPQVFSVLNDTEIPLLRDHVHTITNEGKRPDVEIIVENLGQFVFGHKLQKYVAEDIPVASSAQEETRESVEEMTNSWETKYGPIIDCFSDHIAKGFTAIKRKLEEGAKDAEKEACSTCLSWGSKQPVSPGKSSTSKTSRKSANLPFATYKATVGRYGVYSSKTQGSINFNEDLTDPVYKSLTSIWDKVFSDLVNKALPKLIQQFHAATDIFTLCVKLTEIGVSEERRKNIQSQILQRLMNRLNNMVADLKKIIINRQREISRFFTPCVQELLTPTYRKCQQEHGQGAFQRMKNHLEGTITEGKHQIFAEAIDTVMTELSALKEQIVDYVKTECKKIINDLKGILEPLWEEPDRQELPQYTELKDAILTACTNVCEIYSLAGITKKEQVPELSPTVYSSQSEDEEAPGQSLHCETSTQNRNPPALSPEFSIIHTRERVAPSSTQSKSDDSESDENSIPSTFPSAVLKTRASYKLWSSQNNTQTESTEQQNHSSRINETNLFDFSADEDPGLNRTRLSSLKNVSQRQRSRLTEKQTMKSQLRSICNDPSFSRTITAETDLQKVPVSERQQIAMLRQMSKDKYIDAGEPKEEIENMPIVPNKKRKARSKAKQNHSSQPDELYSLLREISKHKEQTKHNNQLEKDNSNDSLPDLNQSIQTKRGYKRKKDETSPELPNRKRRTFTCKSSKTNSMEEGIKNLCTTRVMRRHTQNELDSRRRVRPENRHAKCPADIVSERDVRRNDNTEQVKHGINNAPNKRKDTTTSATGTSQRSDGGIKSNLSSENSVLKDDVCESIFEGIRREKSSEQVKSSSNMLNYLGLKTSSFINREKDKSDNSTVTKFKRKGRKVSIENAFARKVSSSSKEDQLPNKPSSQLVIKKEPVGDIRPTPGPRWPASGQEVIDLTEDSD